MRTKAHILNTHGPNAPALYKLNPVNKILVGFEIDGVSESASALATARSQESSTTLLNGYGTRAGGVSAAEAIAYLNANKQLTGTILSSSTVSFNSGWLTAPVGLPVTSVDNFTFFHKQMTWNAASTIIPRSAIVSFTQSSNSSTLILNTTNLDYELVTGDQVLGVGKFINQDSLS
jgi:hypothetical protein